VFGNQEPQSEEVYQPIPQKPEKTEAKKKVLKKQIEEVHMKHFDGMSKKEYLLCKLTSPTLTQFKHLHKSLVNQTIDKVNQVVMTLFK